MWTGLHGNGRCLGVGTTKIPLQNSSFVYLQCKSTECLRALCEKLHIKLCRSERKSTDRPVDSILMCSSSESSYDLSSGHPWVGHLTSTSRISPPTSPVPSTARLVETEQVGRTGLLASPPDHSPGSPPDGRGSHWAGAGSRVRR